MSARILVLPLAALLTLGVAGCTPATSGGTTPTPSASGSSSATSDPASDPGNAVSVDNCGFALTVATPPRKIVTIKSTSEEMLLALGLGDRIIGTAFPDGPVPDQWADAAKDIPVISDFAPAQEAVLALEPDFVYGGWESNFAADTAGDREQLKGLGIGTYVSPAACKAAAYQPPKLTFDDVFAEIGEVGKIFGATDAATAVVTAQKEKLATVTADQRGFTALWYSSGTDTPYVGAGIGAPQMMLEKLGLTNVAADVKDTWTSLSWEAIVAADPDVIVLVDASWNTADSKIAALEANPVTAGLFAVQNGRYLTIPFAAGEAGVRNVDATAELAGQLSRIVRN